MVFDRRKLLKQEKKYSEKISGFVGVTDRAFNLQLEDND
jgi:hypothetical protein